MNQLSLERRAGIVRCLVDGNSIRATCRITGAAKNTVIKLLVDLGEMCSLYQAHVIRGLPAKRIQCDEIWSFVGAKARAVKRGADAVGDVYTWTALDADTKLMITWLVGPRDHRSARTFMGDLAHRVTGRPQITTDGFAGYYGAVDQAFGWRAHYAMLIKVYAAGTSGSGYNTKYSPPVCIGAEKVPQWGDPDPDHVSTSYVERANLTMRMGMRRFTRLTNAFSRKVENHAHAVALHFMHYNFCRAHTTLTGNHPHHYPVTPAMAAGLADHVWTVEEVCALLDPARPLR
jgi:IS1 family transposase